jgi:hypothetical protein
MLAGQKPLARFVAELGAPSGLVGDEGFDEQVSTGKISRFVSQEADLEFRYYFLPGQEWRVKVLELVRLHSKGTFDEDDLHRLDGTLLGYPRMDIEKFIGRLHRRRSGKVK